MKESFPALSAEQIKNSLEKDILDYSPEILISERTASTNDDAKKSFNKSISREI